MRERETERENAVHFNSRFLNLLSLTSIFTLALHFISSLGFLPFGKSLQDEYPANPSRIHPRLFVLSFHTTDLFFRLYASLFPSSLPFSVFAAFILIFLRLSPNSLALLSLQLTIRAIRIHTIMIRICMRFLVFSKCEQRG